MRSLLKNLAFLAILALVLWFVAPDRIRQIMALFGGLGKLPFFLIMVFLAALPKPRRGRQR